MAQDGDDSSHFELTVMMIINDNNYSAKCFTYYFIKICEINGCAYFAEVEAKIYIWLVLLLEYEWAHYLPRDSIYNHPTILFL